MDIEAVAKKIRQAIMDKVEDDGRVFHASSLDEVIARELRGLEPKPVNYYGLAVDTVAPKLTSNQPITDWYLDFVRRYKR